MKVLAHKQGLKGFPALADLYFHPLRLSFEVLNTSEKMEKGEF
jgi:hypothetical protein